MWPFSRPRERCYCAFCKSERQIYVKKHISLTNVVECLLLAVSIAYVYFGEPDPRLVVLFGIFILAGETFVYLRWRNAVICKLCGFDPILYKRSPELAAGKVREFFESRMNKPEFLLSRTPLHELRRRISRSESTGRRDLDVVNR